MASNTTPRVHHCQIRAHQPDGQSTQSECSAYENNCELRRGPSPPSRTVTANAPASRSPCAKQSVITSETTAHGEAFEAELPHFALEKIEWPSSFAF